MNILRNGQKGYVSIPLFTLQLKSSYPYKRVLKKSFELLLRMD